MTDESPNLVMKTPRELAQVFNQQIRPTLTGSPRADPVVVFVGGQPGAGKSTVQRAVLERMGRADAFPLDGDDLLAQHPQYAALQRKNDLQAAYLASESVGGAWWNRAARLLRAQKLDVAVSAPLAGPQWAGDRFAEFRKAGYRTEALLVAVHEARSLQGIADRYQSARNPPQGQYGRWVLPEGHDIAYPGVLATADHIDRTHAVDAVHVGRRDGSIIHTNELTPDGKTWHNPVSTRQIIDAERNRPWTQAESAEFLMKQGRLRQSTTEEWRPLLDTIDRRAQPVISPEVVLKDDQLTEQGIELAQAREQAVLRAEVAACRSQVLTEQQHSGANAAQLETLRSAGASPQQIAQAETTQNHDRWGAGLSEWRLSQQIEDLNRATGSVLSEVHRRDELDPQTRQFEDQGRHGHQAQGGPQARYSLVPAAVEPVTVERESPTHPGPTEQAPTPAADSPQPDRPSSAQPGRTSPARSARSTEQRLSGAYDGTSSTSASRGPRSEPPRRQPSGSPQI